MMRFRGAALAAIATFAVLLTAAACHSGSAGTTRLQTDNDTAGSTAPACDRPADHTIVVGSDRVSCKQARLSKSRGNQITWRSEGGGKIEVVFRARDGKVPFPDLACPGSAPVCNSGKIADDAEGSYDYDVWLYTDDGRKAIDPNVIIDP